MLTLHHLETSRSQRVLWLLEELNLPYALETYPRDAKTRLAPPALKRIHPLGLSPILCDRGLVIAESGAIIEYLAERYGAWAPPDMAHLDPKRGSPEHLQCRYWMHFAEGSLMNWLLLQLVFDSIAAKPLPLLLRPIVGPVLRGLRQQVHKQLIAPHMEAAMAYMNQHLAQQPWFAGEHLTMADFQMGFAVEAALARCANPADWPHLQTYRQRMQAREAYQRAIAKGGPVVMKL